MCDVPALFSPLSDIAPTDSHLATPLGEIFTAAFLEPGLPGRHFSFFFDALNEKFKLGFAPTSSFPVSGDTILPYGYRATAPTGRKNLAKHSEELLVNFPAGKIMSTGTSLAIGAALEEFAAVCVSGEREFNEKIAKRVVTSQTARTFSQGSLRWLTHLRDARCIGAASFDKMALPLAKQSRDSLKKLSRDERVRTMAILINAGYGEYVAPEYIGEVIGLLPEPAEVMNDKRSYMQLDVFLAGAYVLANALARAESPEVPRDILAQAARRLKSRGVVLLTQENKNIALNFKCELESARLTP